MEFDLIERYFKKPFESLRAAHADVCLLGIGDDCARIAPLPDHHLFVSTDTLESGVHFFEDVDPADLGWKALAVSLSDLASCGAKPLGFTLNLAMSLQSPAWLEGFSKALLDIASRFNCPLVGGDTTARGANTGLGVVVTVMGCAPTQHTGLPRHGAALADDVWVSGLPGLARLGLLLECQNRDVLPTVCAPDLLDQTRALLLDLPIDLQIQARNALHRPTPRIELGLGLHGIANACIDLSDGLSGDLRHVAHASQQSIALNVEAVRALWMAWWLGADDHMDALLQISWAGGDDYELCFTTPEVQRNEVGYLASRLNLPLSRIGRVVLLPDTLTPGVFLQFSQLDLQPLAVQSHNHFQVK